MPADDPSRPGPGAAPPLVLRPRAAPSAYGFSVLGLLVTTLLALGVGRTFGPTEVIMVYLLGVVFSALRYGRGPALLTSTLSVAAFNFLFVPPRYTFAVSDVRYTFTFAGMFIIGLVISNLTARVRWQADMALAREQHTGALYALTRALSRERDTSAVARRAAEHVADSFACQARVLLVRGEARAPVRAPVRPNEPADSGAAPALQEVSSAPTPPLAGDVAALDETELALSLRVLEHNEPAGLGTRIHPEHPSLHLPLAATDRCLGVLVVRPRAGEPRLSDPAQRSLLFGFGAQIALALERALWAEEAQRTALRAEKEELRNTLLSSVSHDLRTPLAAIAGAASTLIEQEARFDGPPPRMAPALRRELLQTICDEAEHLNRLVRNLLDMTRLEFGGLALRKEWIPLGEVVGSALNRLEKRLAQHRVVVSLPPELPLIPMDPVLAEQLFHNLIENAIKYTPPASVIEISARSSAHMVTVAVADRGPGLPPDAEERVFEKFFRGPYRHGEGGVGLGLTICRGIVEAHGGQISAANRSGGGAVFCFTLPIEGEPPPLPQDTPLDEPPGEPADENEAPHGARAPA